MPSSSFLVDLNKPQYQAVVTTEGPVMVIAGAGSGKTRVITYRIAHLIISGLCKADEILAVTFTNKAAKEMKNRIRDLLDSHHARGLWIGTFHSNFAKILRIHAEELNYTKNFSIYDSEDAEKTIKVIMMELGHTPKTVSPRTIQAKISIAKNKLIYPSEFSQKAKSFIDDITARVYHRYVDKLRENNAMDFDDLLIKPIELFRKFPDILDFYQNRFKYILIDEYQDTNKAQYMIAKMLSAKHHNLSVVGDDAQSIYSWRGAEVDNILRFEKDYSNTTVIKLHQNYRCTQNILDVANSVIACNKNQIQKDLTTDNESGELIALFSADTEIAEANKVGEAIRDLKLQEGRQNKDFAIFYRTNYQSRSIEDALRQNGIRYKIYGGLSFYKRKEIKDVTAYLRFVNNTNDEEALSRIINYPSRGIGDVSFLKIIETSRRMNLSAFDVILRSRELALPERIQASLSEFRELILSLQETAAKQTIYDVMDMLYQKTNIVDILKQQDTSESNARCSNLEEFLNYARIYTEKRLEDSGDPSLQNFIQEIALATDSDEDEDDNTVSLMTVHAAKGLEFPVVLVVGLEENLFPLSVESQEELEEERRLFYVAITRAQKRLFLFYARNRHKYGSLKPGIRSRFIKELEGDVVILESGRSLSDFLADEDESGRILLDNKSPRWMQEDYRDEDVLPKSFRPKGSITNPAKEAKQINYAIGMNVSHRFFGSGKIIAVEGNGDQKKVRVIFRKVGEKTLVTKFANLTVNV